MTADIRSLLVFVDPHLVVVAKPPGLDTVPYEESGRPRRLPVPGARPGRRVDARGVPTLVDLVAECLTRGRRHRPLQVVQRLDRETSGLLVFGRRPEAARHLQQQLRRHSMHRRYLALAHGLVRSRTFRTHIGLDRGDGKRGSTRHASSGQEAITQLQVLEQLGQTTFVECHLETGRTHQIRIHLAEAGHPLLGERIYGRPEHRVALPGVVLPRILLHAAELGFVHPVQETPMKFACPMPADMQAVLEQLRNG